MVILATLFLGPFPACGLHLICVAPHTVCFFHMSVLASLGSTHSLVFPAGAQGFICLFFVREHTHLLTNIGQQHSCGSWAVVAETATRARY